MYGLGKTAVANQRYPPDGTDTDDHETLHVFTSDVYKRVMELGDGDVCTMEGLTQKHYQHRVPKEGGGERAPLLAP